jgi:tetratricopeptide (TPR) repeat protein
MGTVPFFPLPGGGSRTSDRFCLLAVCCLLLLAVGLVFGQTAGFGFVNYDDGGSVYENPLVIGKLTVRGVWAAFTERHLESWAPLTCVSHMLVWHFFGRGPAAHHLVNVLLHAASVVLLFLVFRRMTGRFWPSALVAAIFAMHPLHVESVAWVTERKDALSGLLFMLTLAAYLRYVRQADRDRRAGGVSSLLSAAYARAVLRYLIVLACIIAGLAAKPMAVTLPLLLLLLDYWPLGRILGADRSGKRRVIWEKIPMLAIAVFFCLWTVHGQAADALEVNRHFSFAWRIGNALISYVTYLVQFFCPQGLAAYYPRRPVPLPPWQAAAAAVTLAAITAAVIRWRRQCPYLLVGWLWYVGMLLPVIGLVQFGTQAEADRFTYLPQIGLAIALVWLAADALRTRPRSRQILALAATFGMVILLIAAWRQTSYWRDSEVLWARTLACTSQNTWAHDNLGIALAERGRIDQAIAEFRKALEITPDYAEGHDDLGVALAGCGRIYEAIGQYQRALKIKPDYAEALNNLGNALVGRGQIDEAIALYQKALKIKPDYAEALNNLGTVWAGRGQIDEAIADFQKALKNNPDYAQAHNNLGFALAGRGRLDDAIAHYRRALEIKPHYAEAHNRLGIALARGGRMDDAIAHFRKALEIKPNYAEAHYNLGNALAGRGRFDEAIAHFQRALEILREGPGLGHATEQNGAGRRVEGPAAAITLTRGASKA